MADWAYRCLACGEVVEVEDVEAHIDSHRARPDWHGVLSMERVDRDREEAP